MKPWKIYTAKLANGQNICNIFAHNLAEAQREVFIELNLNPSRKAFLNKWINDGKIVVNEKDA